MTDRGTVTLADVARAAGVSLATASRALNGSARRVRPEYVARVTAAARELRYSPNVQAQAVARGTTTTVALVVGDVADPYFAQIAAGAMRAAEDAGLVLTITATNGDPAREEAALDGVVGLRPRAVVLAASRRIGADGAGAAVPGTGDPDQGTASDGRSGAVPTLRANGAGVVALVSDDADADADVDVPGASVVDLVGATPLVIGNRAGAAALAGALVDEGHRDFAVLAGEPSLLTAHARTAGFLDGLGARGVVVPDDRVVAGAFTRDGGFAAMSELLFRAGAGGGAVGAAGAGLPGCVFAVNDVMAVGALAAIREIGLEPGRDIAVAGFDDVRTLADVVPGLSTVRLPLEEIGALAVRAALGEDVPAVVPGEVVLRASTRRA